MMDDEIIWMIGMGIVAIVTIAIVASVDRYLTHLETLAGCLP